MMVVLADYDVGCYNGRMKSESLRFVDIAKVRSMIMTLNVSTSEAKAKLSSFVQQVVGNREEVIIENRGAPQAVLISYGSYEQYSKWRDQNRRQRALEELQELADSIQSRNQDLSETETDEMADRLSRDVIDEMVADGKINYDSGRK
jgi:prevent-host-death family protein